MSAYFVAIALVLAFPADPPRPFQPLPELKDSDLARPNHMLTQANKDKFAASEPLPVGDFVLIVLPVQQGTAYRWKLAGPVPASLQFANADKDKPDLRQIRKGIVDGTAPPALGRIDALQVFKFKIAAPDPMAALKIRLVSVVDGTPSDKTFEVVLKTGRH